MLAERNLGKKQSLKSYISEYIRSYSYKTKKDSEKTYTVPKEDVAGLTDLLTQLVTAGDKPGRQQLPPELQLLERFKSFWSNRAHKIFWTHEQWRKDQQRKLARRKTEAFLDDLPSDDTGMFKELEVRPRSNGLGFSPPPPPPETRRLLSRPKSHVVVIEQLMEKIKRQN